MLRAFLRFCYLDGRTAADLAWAAQGVTGWRRSALPKGIRLALEAEVTVHGKGSRAKRLPQRAPALGNATPADEHVVNRSISVL